MNLERGAPLRAPIDPLTPYVPAVNRFLGLSRSSAVRLMENGQAKVIKVGKRLMIRESELRRLIDFYESRTSGRAA